MGLNDKNDVNDIILEMIKPEYKYSDITSIIIGCAMKVHNSLGKGFPEVIYQRAFLVELEKTTLRIQREVEQEVYYENKLVGKRRVDFLVEGKILVEVKAIDNYTASSFNQILNYLHAFNLEVGLLINFGKDRLEYKRFTNNKMK